MACMLCADGYVSLRYQVIFVINGRLTSKSEEFITMDTRKITSDDDCVYLLYDKWTG